MRKQARPIALALISSLIFVAAAFSQAAPFNAVEVGAWDEPGQDFADIWGEGNFAYIAHSGQRVVTIVDITDPAAPTFAARYDAVTLSSAQDVKVEGGLMFVGLENASPGVHIVDVRDPYAPVKLTDVTVMSSVHNVFYDQGWLYIVDSSQTRIEIVDLRDYDPDAAPATISTSTWTLTGVGGQLVHDITVRDGRLYAAAWDSLQVYDVSNIADEAPSLLGSTYGDNLHAVWPSDDGQFVVTTEERTTGAATLYEVIEGVDSIELVTRDYFTVPLAEAASAHNPLVVGNRVFISWYASGVQVLEIDPVTKTLFQVASFDTTPDDGDDGTFAGCWGVYPFLSEDLVLASDRALGLSVVDFDPEFLKFHGVGDLPDTVPSGGGPIEISIQAVGAAVDSATVEAQVTNDGSMSTVPLAPQGGRLFAGVLPAAACGDTLEVSFVASNTLGTAFTDPASGGGYRIDVMDIENVLFEDDFSLDLGWTVTDIALTSGSWVRDAPVGTSNQPEFDSTRDPNGLCYFTGQAFPGDSVGTNDVDGGPTILTSPLIDHSGGGGVVSYWYWISDASSAESLVVEVSSDGSTWVEARSHGGDPRQWQKASFALEDFVAPSSTTQIRFVIADTVGTVLEAGIDSVKVAAPICADPIFADGFESGDTSAWSSTS